MGTGGELQEAPMVEEDNQLLKPKRVKRVTTTTEHLREPITDLDQGDVVRNRDVFDASETHMTAKRKSDLYHARKHLQRHEIASKSVYEESSGIRLGDDVIAVEDKTNTNPDVVNTDVVVREFKEPKTHEAFDDLEIPVGTQYAAPDTKPRQNTDYKSLYMFPVLDYALFEQRKDDTAPEHDEHSTAHNEGSSFTPIRTPFNQIASSRLKDLLERSSNTQVLSQNKRSIANELAKYDAMLGRKQRTEYMHAHANTPSPANPQAGFEFSAALPNANGPPAFIREAFGGRITMYQTPSEIEY